MAGSGVADGDGAASLPLTLPIAREIRKLGRSPTSRAETVPQQNRTRRRGKYAATNARWNCGIGHPSIDPARGAARDVEAAAEAGAATAESAVTKTTKTGQRGRATRNNRGVASYKNWLGKSGCFAED